ncbi:MAG: adventurous gliding motility protein GltJ, partial [Archangium sp.]|nr:adventurous gliding motility protein GltJ [Archangium sp.]
MRFVCESCRAQYMINDEKVGPKGVKVRCRKCGYVILVKRADAAKNGPVAMSNDPDDALATQVMQTPLAPAEATLSNDDTQATEMTNPGTNGSSTNTTAPALQGVPEKNGDAKPGDSFFGADEDEIGAVFDQVLKTGGAKDENGAPAANGDDRQSTRVIDAETVRKLAEESGVVEKAAEPAAKVEEAPTTDWYVAINEKQTGPLTLDKIKEHWDKGEISPDSLCWRAGFDDWIPVSEVKMLTAVLAPKPPKPIVVAPAATITQSTPALVSMPVQSAFSSGGMMQTMQSEVQVPMSAVSASGIADREESGSWKPSAGLALASLVKDEMEAQSKPPPKAPPVVMDEAPMGKGLLDLPSAEEKATNSAVVLPSTLEARSPPRSSPSQPPVNPYLANQGATYSSPAVTQYRPPNNRNLMIGVAAGGGVLLLVLIGLVVWLAVRDPVVIQQPVVQNNPPVVNNPPVAVNNPPVANTNPPVANTNPPTTNGNPPPVANANGTNPPAPNTNPPVNNGNPPVANTNPPVAANNPPVANNNPPGPVAPKNPNKTNNNTTRNQNKTEKDPDAEPKNTKPPKETKTDEGG